MISLKDLLKRNNIRAHKYKKRGSVTIIDSDEGSYVLKKKNTNNEIYKYLNNRKFNYYPNVIDSNSEYEIYPFIEDIVIPKEQKINDLIQFVALLHAKTTYYKEIDESDYKQLYEDISNNIIYLREYYNDLIALIDNKVFFSPDENLLANNISLFFERLDYCEKEKEKWYKTINNRHKIRVAVVHNNLELDHFLQNDDKYLISWNKSKIDLPIFDLYKLYQKYYNNFDFIELLHDYEKEYKLKNEEKMLLVILISMPKKLDIEADNYLNCMVIKNEIKRLLKSRELEKNINFQ